MIYIIDYRGMNAPGVRKGENYYSVFCLSAISVSAFLSQQKMQEDERMQEEHDAMLEKVEAMWKMVNLLEVTTAGLVASKEEQHLVNISLDSRITSLEVWQEKTRLENAQEDDYKMRRALIERPSIPLSILHTGVSLSLTHLLISKISWSKQQYSWRSGAFLSRNRPKTVSPPGFPVDCHTSLTLPF